MMKKILFVFFIVTLSAYSQDDGDDGMLNTSDKEKKEITNYGKKYLEDQLYIGLTYNHLLSKPRNVVQHNMSRAVHLGFLRDIPMNEQRNIGLAVGLGYAYDLVYSNIVASSEKGNISYQIISGLNNINISKNYFDAHSIEIPVEFRWRTSTPNKFKFWRIYTGVRIGYVVDAKSLIKQNEITHYFSNSDLENKWQFKVFSAFGYNAINFFVQYSLTPIFKDKKTIDDVPLKSSVLQMGLMFYIL